jgi:hypothetical protein
VNLSTFLNPVFLGSSTVLVSAHTRSLHALVERETAGSPMTPCSKKTIPSNCDRDKEPEQADRRAGKEITGYEYAVLVSNTDYEILSLGFGRKFRFPRQFLVLTQTHPAHASL